MTDREALAQLLAGYLDPILWDERPVNNIYAREVRGRNPEVHTQADLLEMADAAIACLRERWANRDAAHEAAKSNASGPSVARSDVSVPDPPTADATAGPYRVERKESPSISAVHSYIWYIVYGETWLLRSSWIEADTWCQELNIAYRAGRAALLAKPPTEAMIAARDA